MTSATHDYPSAVAALVSHGRPVDRRKVANHTYLHRTGPDTIAVRLHATDVVTYWACSPLRPPDCGIQAAVLDTGGFLTMVTAERINGALPTGVRLGSDRGTWSLGLHGASVRYADGLTVEQYGTEPWQANADTVPSAESQVRQDRHNTSVRRLVTAYLKGLEPRQLGQVLGNAHDDADSYSAGCALCLPAHERAHPGTKTRPGRPWYVSIGDEIGDTQHLLEHLHQGVYSKALLTLAVTEAGYDVVVLGHAAITKRALRRYLTNRLYVGATAPTHGRHPVQTGAIAA